MATVEISIVNDTVVNEEDEEFQLILTLSPLAGVRITPGVRSNVTAVIIDTSMLIINDNWLNTYGCTYSSINAICNNTIINIIVSNFSW